MEQDHLHRVTRVATKKTSQIAPEPLFAKIQDPNFLLNLELNHPVLRQRRLEHWIIQEIEPESAQDLPKQKFPLLTDQEIFERQQNLFA